MPAGYLEAGWRIDRAHWGKGLATEGGAACVRYALDDRGAAGVGAITTVTNAPSINVMRKVGMTVGPHFMHPDIDPADPVAPHVLYSLAGAVRNVAVGRGRGCDEGKPEGYRVTDLL